MLRTARKKSIKKVATMLFKTPDFNKLTELINMVIWQAIVRGKEFRRTDKD